MNMKNAPYNILTSKNKVKWEYYENEFIVTS